MAVTKEQANLLVAFATNGTGDVTVNGVKFIRVLNEVITVKIADVETWIFHPIYRITESALWVESEKNSVQIRIPIKEVEKC